MHMKPMFHFSDILLESGEAIHLYTYLYSMYEGDAHFFIGHRLLRYGALALGTRELELTFTM